MKMLLKISERLENMIVDRYEFPRVGDPDIFDEKSVGCGYEDVYEICRVDEY
jgi:hypothetical protein